MNGILRILAGAALVALAGCGSEEPAENLQAKASELEAAADQAPDNTQAEVLDNQADALRNAAEGGGEEKADTNGSVTVIEE